MMSDIEKARVDTWKPYDYLRYVEVAMQEAGVDYIVTDISGDIRCIVRCLNMLKARNKGPGLMIPFIRWCASGLDKSVPLTSLSFMCANAHSYFGDLPRKNRAPVSDKPASISKEMASWLSSLKKEKRRQDE